MIRWFFSRIAKIISEILQNPLKVFIYSFVLVSLGLLFDGSLMRLWRLNHDSADLAQRMNNLRIDEKTLEAKIRRARDPNFIELEAREKFDLASEGDLVFVFSDDE